MKCHIVCLLFFVNTIEIYLHAVAFSHHSATPECDALHVLLSVSALSTGFLTVATMLAVFCWERRWCLVLCFLFLDIAIKLGLVTWMLVEDPSCVRSSHTAMRFMVAFAQAQGGVAVLLGAMAVCAHAAGPSASNLVAPSITVVE